ncbi:hypothetical protein ACDI16_07185 [Oceanobacillus caeni]
MSWAVNPLTALFFRERKDDLGNKSIYKITVKPESVLAAVSDIGSYPFHHEFIEYILDIETLNESMIEEYDSPQIKGISEIIQQREIGKISETEANKLIELLS